jgi:AMME syndrome candidate gene 1 protein
MLVRNHKLYTQRILTLSVSLLINFETCADPLDWTRGVHGIRIVFPHPLSPSRRRLSATYLPDVCTDQGWTKDECLESLMRKAGYDPSYSRGSNSGGGGWRSVQGLKVERYRALKGRISYEGYVDAVSEMGKLN